MERDLQLRGDVLGLPTQRHEPQDFQLARRQRLHVGLVGNLRQRWWVGLIVLYHDDQITQRLGSVGHPFTK